MKTLIKYAGMLAAGLMIPASSLLVYAQVVQPPVLSNTATAQYSSGPLTITVPSNTYNITVQTPPQTAPELEVFQLSNAANATQASLPATMCLSSNGPQLIDLEGAFGNPNGGSSNIISATAIRPGEPLVIQVQNTDQNVDPATIDQFEVVVTTQDGDSENIILTETDVDSGNFVGIINTRTITTPTPGDCALFVTAGQQLQFDVTAAANGELQGTATVDILVDPFGTAFDSADGAAVSGTQITLIDTATGAPAQVFGVDGVSIFPSTIITDGSVNDSSGRIYNFPLGFYRFPFVRPGTYQLLVTPPSPFTFPSTASAAQIALLTKPDGSPFIISGASYGGTFTLNDPAPVQIDIPLDQPGVGSFILTKTASTDQAAPGDVIQYRIEVRNPDPARVSGEVTISDSLPPSMRLRLNSFRYNGQQVIPVATPDGLSFDVQVPPLAGGETGILTYLAEVRQDARPGNAVNVAIANDNRGATSPADGAAIRIVRDGISERFTIVGRITAGGCSVHPDKAEGLAGIRVIMEDGTYSVTDEDGRYHFEGILPGLHVVQVDPESFPLDQAPVDCTKNTRSAGSAISRFVEGQGGSVKRADFRSKTVAPRKGISKVETELAPALTDQEAAGTNRDWLLGQQPGTAIIFPGTTYNPRGKSLRVVVKHLPEQTVKLFLNGEAVGSLNYDGMRKNADGSVQVRVWRGILAKDGTNKITAQILNQAGVVVETLHRDVYLSGPPLYAKLVKEKSILKADGISNPRVAILLTDRSGNPVPHGTTGEFAVDAPYQPAIGADARQANQISGLQRAKPVWRVHGDEGIAYVELEPTTASGTLRIGFDFQDGEVKREQNIETWLDPGDRPWTVVGFAAGTIGFNKLEQGLESLDREDGHIDLDGRIALYAKGRVSGKWLMTMSYDTDKVEDEARFAGVIDPRRYYTIYGDRTDQRYDASSVRRLYLKLERPQFYALFGDYQTGINEPELARYQRSLNGVKAEYRSEQFNAQVFGSDTPYRYRREEIQGNGLSGPYALGSRIIIANSERITIETRDRLRSDRIIDRETLLRHIDYDINYVSGTIIFKKPVLSRSSGFDPQFIIAEYEVDGVGQRVANAGGRAQWKTKDEKLQIGATFVHDETDQTKTDLAGADLVYRPSNNTEIRAEVAGTAGETKSGSTAPDRGNATAWLLEVEHHTETLDVQAYARQQDAGFGVGQNNQSETGTRKIGADARLRVTPHLAVSVLAYQEDYLQSDARRQSISGEAEYRTGDTTFRAGVTHVNDQLADGTTNESTIARIGASQKLLNGKLEVSGQTEFALGGQNESVDFPARHQINARYAVTNNVKLIGGYEIADGENIDARTARIGFDVTPWSGGRITATGNQQEISEYGPRTFAAYGLSQSLRVSENWTVDVTLDGNKTLRGINRNDVQNPLQPVASGGFIGNNGTTLTEDFTAVTSGATYHGDRWTWTGRVEHRDGETTNRYGGTTAILRQIGEGRAVGGALSWFRASEDGGARTTTALAEISAAIRPSGSRWSILNKTEYRYDSIKNAVAGLAGPIGGPNLTINGDAKSRRVINSLSINYTSIDDQGGNFVERGEYALFWGTRYIFDRFGLDEVSGWSNIIGADLRFDIDSVADIGVSGTARIGTGARNIAYSGGPAITVSPFENGNISLGYNIVGFYDRDFEESRYTRAGPYITFKVKFDQTSLAGIGL